MRAIVFYRRNSESESLAERYATDFYRATGKQLELTDVDTPAGTDLARLHDIVEYPAILALADDGQALNMWQGGDLPLIDEVNGYLS